MPTVARRPLALVLSALCLLLLDSAAARAEIYWTDSASFSDNWIGRALNSGGSVTAPFIPSTREIGGIASDGRHLYWVQYYGAIMRANLDGSDPEVVFNTPSGAGSLATDGQWFYWSVPNEPRISRVRVDGSGFEADFVLLEDGAWPAGVATDGTHLYWTDNGHSRIGRIGTDGTGRQDEFIAGVGYPNGIAVAGGYIYWADADMDNYAIGRARSDGSGADGSWHETTSLPAAVSVAGGYVYWTEPPVSRIGRVAVSGSGANANLINGLTWPTAIFVTAPGFAASAAPAFGNVVLGTRATRTVTVTNDSAAFAGGQPLTFAAGAVTLTGANANQFSITSNGCSGQTIAPGDSCQVTVAFAPTTTGAKSASLRFVDNATSSPQTVALSGRGTQGIASLSSTTGLFGDARTGTTSEAQSFTVTNSASGANAGPITYAAGAVTLTGAAAGQFSIVSDSCSGTTVAPAARCTVAVAFAPTADGAASAALQLVDDAPGSPRAVALSGNGVTPSPQLSPATHGFGELLTGASSEAVAFTVVNSGTGAVTLPPDAVSLDGAGAAEFEIVSDLCSGQTLAPVASCTVDVVFSPSAGGAASARLLIDHDAGAPLEAALSGIGVVPSADLTLTPTDHDFGSVRTWTTSAPVALRVSNLGTAAAAIPSGAVSIDAFGATAAFSVADGCSTVTLDPGEDCTVSVTFGPRATGAASATVEIADGDGGTLSASLAGTGIAPLLALSPASHDFGSLPIGASSAPATFTLANHGSAPATLPAGAASLAGLDAGAWTITDDDCSGATLAIGDDCVVTVVFAPTAAGAASATLAVGDGDGGTLGAALTGSGAEPARRDPQPDPDPAPRSDPEPRPRTSGDGGGTPQPQPQPQPTPRRTSRTRLTTHVGGAAGAVVGADGTLRLRCALAGATLRGCAAVVTPAGGGRALGDGTARVGRGGGRSATVVVRLGARARVALERSLGGVRAVVTVTATTRDGRRLKRSVRVTLLAKRQQVVTLPGAFAPDAAALTPAGAAFLRDVAGRLRAARAILCTGFTATRGEQGSDEAAAALGLARGRVACALLRRLGVKAKLTPRSGGRGKPLAVNDDEDGRARNRRVELTITR
ncbi:choice-of-anchor D domain-containing protein [Conexibacter stalactiti]|uniref:Choice-of-anchor D domain-containing protein n=1 Tax=Conexibacter stalactiti TaxID=1940611 RepID=A0ABU4HXN3_9ACTN|nr:choice-of-anchor D domain-containing protein [Conexibacter stalactiti]MDW5598092.1 choice-of-anchor D domain-containing protein [Conexibacter stalactiti]MEC5038734.1 choice-of-anchor D domain-containing protein [Conexibacter stalactiti]